MVQQSYYQDYLTRGGVGGGGRSSIFPWLNQEEEDPLKGQHEDPYVFGNSGIYAGFDDYLPGSVNQESGDPNWPALTTGAPLRFAALEREADPLIRRMYSGAYGSGVEGLTRGRGYADRQAADEFAANGISPAVFYGRIRPEQEMSFSSRLAELRGNALSGEAGARLNLKTAIVSGLNQVEPYYDQLRLQNKLNKDALRAQDKAGRQQMIGSLVGLGLSGLGRWGMAGGGPFAGLAAPGGGGIKYGPGGPLF
jgi:hypothetical protein